MAIRSVQFTKRLMVFALICETLSATYMLSFPKLVNFATILYGVAGITIAITFLLLPEFLTLTLKAKYLKQKAKDSLDHASNNTQKAFSVLRSTLRFHKPLYWYKKVFIFVLGIIAVKFSVQWMEDAPLDFHDADMLPIMKIMCQRFIAGKGSHVYDVIPEIWNGIQPVYFPAMWMPYCIAVLNNLDLRWVTVSAIFSAVVIFFALLRPAKHQLLSLLSSLSLFIVLWWILTSDNSGIIPYTEEGIIIFYYSLLALALFTDSFIFVGIVISLCVLSRYALAGWIPAMMIYWLWTKQYKGMITVILTGITCFVLLMLIPFGWNVFQRLFFLPGEYIDFAKRVWNDAPQIFNQTLGFAKYFGKDGIHLQHKLLIITALTFPTFFMVTALFFYKKKSHYFTLSNLPIAILKTALVIFYCMIDVPYLYLFYTSVFFSFIIVVMSLRIEETKINSTV